MKKCIAVLIILILCLSVLTAEAERKAVVKDNFYIGAMRVVKCKEFVSLRSAPDKTSKVLAKVPKNAIVLYCSNNVRQYAKGPHKKQAELFIRCEYEGQEGYILKKHLRPAPEAEPAETRQSSDIMTRDEVIGNGQSVLDWNEFNVSVQAAYEEITEERDRWEYIRIGCFINDEPIWGYTEAVKQEGKPVTLKVFMGGMEDDPMVCVYDEEYGLTMIDLLEGTESWIVPKWTCPFGDASVIAVGEETGILYIAGSHGPDPVAVSPEGTILWQSEIDDSGKKDPKEIILDAEAVQVKYGSGKTARLDYETGEVISISE